MKNAISTSAVTGFLISIVGTLSFLYFGLRQEAGASLGYVYFPACVIIGLAATITAPIGAKYAYSTSSVILKRVFGIYQILVGIVLIFFTFE